MTNKPLSISWSALRVHEECHQKSALMRAGKRSKAMDLRSFYHGMVVDWLQRRWLADPDRQPGQMEAGLDDAIESVANEARESGDGVVRWKHVNDKAELRAFCLELVRRLEPILYSLVLPYPFQEGLRFRQPLNVPGLDGTPTEIHLTGEMDLLVHPPEGWIVWDLKGTRDNGYWRKVLGQLVFYDLVVALQHGERTYKVGLIQPMCDEQVMEFTVTDQMRNELLGRIARMATDIWRNDTTCKESPSGCQWCEVRHACPRTDSDLNTLAFGLRAAVQTGAP